MCDRWFENELRPFLTQHHELAITSQKRKIGALRGAVIGASERRMESSSQAASVANIGLPKEGVEALREGNRVLERAQGESFFLTRKIAKMQRAIIDIAAERIATGLIESDNLDAGSILSETLRSLIAEPVAATLRSIEDTREALSKAMDVVASVSDHGTYDELPKPAGMPIVDVNEISQNIVVEKPRMLTLLGKSVVAAYVRRRLEDQYDRTLLEFLSLYANRLRRWMEQSVNALRNAFDEFADMHRPAISSRAGCIGCVGDPRRSFYFA